MKTFPMDLYKLIAFGLGGENWQEFVDNYEEKYNAEVIDGFVKTPIQMDYTFSQLIGGLGVTTLPAYVDPESPGYEKALKEVQGAMGNIPTMKAFYSLNRVTLQKRLALINRIGDAALDEEMQEVFIGMIDESTDGLIKSYYNALTHQRMRIVSTGKFTIDIENNPRGLRGITIDFNIPADHFDTLTTTARWWTNADHTTEGSASDPIQYLKDRIKFIRKTKHVNVPMHIEMAEDLLNDMYTHTKVLTRIGYLLNSLAAITADNNAIALQTARNLTDEQLKANIERLIGMRIVPQDSIAYVDKPNATTHTLDQELVENFAPKNISFIPDGTIGEIQSVNILTLGYEPDKVAGYDGGRLILSQRANPETHSIYIESEAALLCVPKAVNQMFISTVTA